MGFTFPPILKKLMHFGNVEFRENSRAGGLNRPSRTIIEPHSELQKPADLVYKPAVVVLEENA